MAFSRRLAGRQGGLGKAAVAGGTGRAAPPAAPPSFAVSVTAAGEPEPFEQAGAGEAGDRGDAVAGDGEDHDPVALVVVCLVGQVGRAPAES